MGAVKEMVEYALLVFFIGAFIYLTKLLNGVSALFFRALGVTPNTGLGSGINSLMPFILVAVLGGALAALVIALMSAIRGEE